MGSVVDLSRLTLADAGWWRIEIDLKIAASGFVVWLQTVDKYHPDGTVRMGSHAYYSRGSRA